MRAILTNLCKFWTCILCKNKTGSCFFQLALLMALVFSLKPLSDCFSAKLCKPSPASCTMLGRLLQIILLQLFAKVVQSFFNLILSYLCISLHFFKTM